MTNLDNMDLLHDPVRLPAVSLQLNCRTQDPVMYQRLYHRCCGWSCEFAVHT